MRIKMSLFGIIVVLIEFLGIGYYYHIKCYWGIAWCVFWIIGIIYYETKYLKRLNSRINNIKHQLQRRINEHKLRSRNDPNNESPN